MYTHRRMQKENAPLFRMRRRQHLDGFVRQIDSASDFGVRMVRIKHDGARLAQALLEIESDYGVIDANGPVFADKEARDFALTLCDEIPERTALSVRFVAIYTFRIWRRKQRKLNCGLQRAGLGPFRRPPGLQILRKSLRLWRRGSESNRRTRLCRPLHDHSATPPGWARPGPAALGEPNCAPRPLKN